MLYYGYRYLDPVSGRWLSRDPIGEEGESNLFADVTNDGVNRLDRLGNDIIGCDEISKYLDEEGVRNYTKTLLQKGGSVGVYRYSGAPTRGNSEILQTMIGSPREFQIAGGSVNNLKAQLQGRR